MAMFVCALEWEWWVLWDVGGTLLLLVVGGQFTG